MQLDEGNDVCMVSISCLTYNHALYIRSALDSFLMQRTSFSFEVLIHDDASTDGTDEIIREYEAKFPEVIKPLYEQENQWVKGRRGSMVFNIPRANGKYIAFCDGDDCWTDPNKLQKQVDYLEANPDYGLVHTDNSVSDENSGRVIESLKEHKGLTPPSGDVFNALLMDNFISTLTVVARTDLLLKARDLIEKIIVDVPSRDICIWLVIAKHANVFYLPDNTACYRKYSGSVSRPVDRYQSAQFSRGGIDILIRYNDYYETNANIRTASIIRFIDRHIYSIAMDPQLYRDIRHYLPLYRPTSLAKGFLKYASLLGVGFRPVIKLAQLIRSL